MLRWFAPTLLCLALTVSSLAQALAERIPADAIIYAGWHGADALSDAYAGSRLKGLLADSSLPRLFSETLPALANRAGQESPVAGEIIRTIIAVGEPLWHRPCALYFGGIDFTQPANPTPRLAFLCDGGDRANDLLKLVNDALARAGAPMQAQLLGGRYILLAPPMFPPPQALLKLLVNPADGPSLAAAPAFANCLAKTRKNAALTVYIDVEALVTTVNEGFTKAGPPGFRPTWEKVRDALGLDGLKRVIYTAGFDNADWATALCVEAPAPRKGIASLFDAKPLSDDALKSIPKSATYAFATQFDLGALATNIRATAGRAAGPVATGVIDGALAQVQDATGVDLIPDLLDPMGSEWIGYLSPQTAGNSIFGLILANRLDDPAKVKSTLERLEAWVNKTIATATAREKMHIEFKKTTIGGCEIHYMALPLVAPAWTIKDNHLIVAAYPQIVASAASQVGGKAPSLLDNESFQAVRKRLGGGSPSSVAFYDLPKTAPEAYFGMLAITRFALGMSDMFGATAAEPVVPPLDKLAAQLAPAGSVAWCDDFGFHARSIAPFPAAEILATESNMLVAQNAMMVSILLPALNAAKERANRVKCASDLRQIGQGCMLYANDHRKLPPTLGDLVETDISGDVFVCPSGDSSPPSPDIRADRAKLKQWINEHSDYVYLGGKLKLNMPADTMLAYEKPECHERQGLNVLYMDGHVEWMMLPSFQKQLEEQNKQ